MEKQKHAESLSNPSLYKSSYLSEKSILITRSISNIISVIYFSIKISIKETKSATMNIFLKFFIFFLNHL